MAIAAIGVAGIVLGAIVNWALSSTTGRRAEVREVRIQLVDTRDLIWDGWMAVDRHTAKLRTRMHTLGMPRDCLDDLRSQALRACQAIGPVGPAGGDIDPDALAIDTQTLAKFDSALEAADLRVARMGRLVRPPRWRR